MLTSKFNKAQHSISMRLQDLNGAVKNLIIVKYTGSVKSAIGTVITVTLPKSKIGDLCQIQDEENAISLLAEVVSIENNEAKLLPFGNIDKISTRVSIDKLSENFVIPIGEFMVGKILDGFGRVTGSLVADLEIRSDELTNANNNSYPIYNFAPDPLTRKIISEKMLTGVKAIDLFITCGKGQRLAIFAGPGMGKTTLLSMIIKNAMADIIVIALIGERGREVKEFIDLDLDEISRKKCVFVIATSDRPPVEQVKAAYVAQTVAEYFRDQGKDVILFVDSITRFARAQREVGLSAGEPIARGGFPSSVFLAFPKLMERAGNSQNGTLTAFYTVLMESENTQHDPIADEVRSIVDGHIILSKKLVEQSHFPAIDILSSLSRIADRIISPQQLINVRRARLLLSKYNELEFLIRVGEYKTGSDTLADEAVNKNQQLLQFLQQSVNEHTDFESGLKELIEIIQA